MSNEFYSKDLSHHGIVAATCDQIGVVEIIDELIPPDPRSDLSIGECVKLMIINGLGFSSRPLYLESQFFNSKPVERLLGRKIRADQITDDRLGRCLDCCYKANCDLIFSEITTKAALIFNIDKRFRHIDTTSMHVHGEYADQEMELVSFGYSKDDRSDLKQFMISLISSQDGDVPLLAQTIAGNSSDKAHFKEKLTNVKSQIDSNQPAYYVADSALYTADTIEKISQKMKWITRVPENIRSVKTLFHQIDQKDMQDVGGGYYVAEVGSYYGGIKQRWLVIFSEKAKEREEKTFEKRVNKTEKDKAQILQQLCNTYFDCEADARKAVVDFAKTLKYHACADLVVTEKRVSKKQGRPKKNEMLPTRFQVSAKLIKDKHKISHARKKLGKFVIATNELNEDALNNEDILANYKGQQSVERGFRFLKDPLFMCSSVFLKTDTRIVALAMIMCLCLLVYTLAQRLLRKRLALLQKTVPNQKGLPTQRPTMRWIFQIFEGVHLLFQKVNTVLREIVLNLTSVQKEILYVLGPPFQKIYETAD